MIVDLEASGKAGARRRGPLMALAIAALAVGFGALLLRPPDPDSAGRARARALAALLAPTATASIGPIRAGTLLGPSVLARRTPRPALPPLLALPQEIASFVPAGSAAAMGEIRFTASETSRAIVYRLADGRLFVLQQSDAARGHPVIPRGGSEAGTLRGQPARFYTLSLGQVRALIWWVEGPASYYLYSATVSMRELVRLAEQLR